MCGGWRLLSGQPGAEGLNRTTGRVLGSLALGPAEGPRFPRAPALLAIFSTPSSSPFFLYIRSSPLVRLLRNAVLSPLSLCCRGLTLPPSPPTSWPSFLVPSLAALPKRNLCLLLCRVSSPALFLLTGKTFPGVHSSPHMVSTVTLSLESPGAAKNKSRALSRG